MSRWSCLLPLVCLPLAAAAAEPDAAAQVAAMDRIAWLAGRWEGTATTRGHVVSRRAAPRRTPEPVRAEVLS